MGLILGGGCMGRRSAEPYDVSGAWKTCMSGVEVLGLSLCHSRCSRFALQPYLYLDSSYSIVFTIHTVILN